MKRERERKSKIEIEMGRDKWIDEKKDDERERDGQRESE